MRISVYDSSHAPSTTRASLYEFTYSLIPLVRSSSELIVHRTRKSGKPHPLNIHWAAREVRSASRSLPQLHQIPSRDS